MCGETIFIGMNYNRIYYNIIERAKVDARSKKNSYFEKHHIIPNCIGGSDSDDNLVLLTAKEHFICHKLLCLIYPNSNELKFAIWAMSNQLKGDVKRYYRVSSSEYERHKLYFSKANSNLHRGKKLTSSHIDIIRNRMNSDLNPMKGKTGDLNPLYGKNRPDNIKSKISNTKLNNPMKNASFKGLFVTPIGTFTTLREASIAHGLDGSVISSRCKGKSHNKIITKRAVTNINSKDILEEHIGKSFKELGWSFIPMPRQ